MCQVQWKVNKALPQGLLYLGWYILSFVHDSWSSKLVSSEDRTWDRSGQSTSYCSSEGISPLHIAPPVQCQKLSAPNRTGRMKVFSKFDQTTKLVEAACVMLWRYWAQFYAPLVMFHFPLAPPCFIVCTVKKGYRFPVPSRDVTDGREFGQWHPGWGREKI